MVLIYGGAYQGKFDFAKEKFGISKEDIIFFDAENGSGEKHTTAGALNKPVFDKKCIYNWQYFVLAQIREGTDHISYLSENTGIFKDKLIICDDISQGVVPIDTETRLWREVTGRSVTYLSGKSDEVWRVFCGIGTRIK